MLCGCIDIGTNTTRVLVADARDGRLVEVLQRRAFTRLGRGLTAGRRIPARASPRTRASSPSSSRWPSKLARRSIRAVATAAIRGAANRDEFCHAMREPRGVEVNVLDGEEEARLAFLGATRTLEIEPSGRVAVVDVGGGSTEIAVGTVDGGVEWWESFALRLRASRRRLPRRRPADARPARRGALRTPPRCSTGIASRRSTSRSRSAAAPPRCAGSSAPSSTATASPAR